MTSKQQKKAAARGDGGYDYPEYGEAGKTITLLNEAIASLTGFVYIANYLLFQLVKLVNSWYRKQKEKARFVKELEEKLAFMPQEYDESGSLDPDPPTISWLLEKAGDIQL